MASVWLLFHVEMDLDFLRENGISSGHSRIIWKEAGDNLGTEYSKVGYLHLIHCSEQCMNVFHEE